MRYLDYGVKRSFDYRSRYFIQIKILTREGGRNGKSWKDLSAKGC